MMDVELYQVPDLGSGEQVEAVEALL